MFLLDNFNQLLTSLPCYKQLLEREGIDEIIERIVSEGGMAEDHNRNRNWNRNSCVQKVRDVSALYYREKETGDSTSPAERVVAIEDQWDTLVRVHRQLSHAGRQRMEIYT